MGLTEFFTITNLVIATIVLVVGAGATVITWLYRRVKIIAKEANPVDLDTATRVQHIEHQMDRLGTNVDQIEGRVGVMERKMESVATQRDITELAKVASGLEASLRYVGGMVDTMYKAAVRGSDK